MKAIFYVLALLAVAGCSTNEFHDVTQTKATVLSDSTGTAQQVTNQIWAEEKH